MKRRVITTQITATESAQLVALLITMLGPLGYSERGRLIRTIEAYFAQV